MFRCEEAIRMFQDVQEHQENSTPRSHQQRNKNGFQESLQETKIQAQKEEKEEEERRQKEKEMRKREIQ